MKESKEPDTRFLLNRSVVAVYKVVDKVARYVILLGRRTFQLVRQHTDYRRMNTKFAFQREKFAAVMQILCKYATNLDMLKAVKLLYFIDRTHLRAHGRPVLGDFYVAMPLGPVPSRSYDELERVEASEAPDLPLSSEDIGRKYPVFKTTDKPDLSYLSKSELAAIKTVIRTLGHKTGLELSDIAHKHRTWEESKSDLSKAPPIDYTRFFAEDHEACKHAYEAMILGQEERDFAEGI